MVAAVVSYAKHADDRVLLTRRPLHKVRGGLYEFPGGKIEAGEQPRAALYRELEEELGTKPVFAEPLFVIAHQYPDVRVRLHVWSVSLDAHELSVDPGSASAVLWATPDGIAQLELSDADRHIARLLQLPRMLCISADCTPGSEAEWLLRAKALLQTDVSWLLIRTPSQTSQQRDHLVRALLDDGVASKQLAVSRDIDLALRSGIGLQLSSSQLRDRGVERALTAITAWRGASCHGEEEIELANALGLDYLSLSPVLPTLSHPDSGALGWQRAQELALKAEHPVFALGGMDPSLLGEARARCLYGVAGIRSFWLDSVSVV